MELYIHSCMHSYMHNSFIHACMHTCMRSPDWSSGSLTGFFHVVFTVDRDYRKKLVVLHYNFPRAQSLVGEGCLSLGEGGTRPMLPQEVHSWSKVLVR